MTKLHWIPIFALGACAGYGLAIYLYPEKPDIATTQHESQQIVPRPVENPTPQARLPAPTTIAPPVSVSRTDPGPPQPDGLKQIQLSLQAKNWVQVVQLATTQISQNEAYREELWPYLERAYVGLIKSAIDQQALSEAHRLLAEADAQLGVSAPRLILLAELNQMRGDLKATRAAFHQTISTDPSYGEMVYPLLRQVVIALTAERSSTLAFEEKVQILQACRDAQDAKRDIQVPLSPSLATTTYCAPAVLRPCRFATPS